MQQAVGLSLPRVCSATAGGLVGNIFEEFIELPLENVLIFFAFPYFSSDAVEQFWAFYEETVVILGLDALHCSSAKTGDHTLEAVPSRCCLDSVCSVHIRYEASDDFPHIYDDVPFSTPLE